MNDVLAAILLIGVVVGGVLLGVYLCLLPPRLFLRGQRWLTEEEFREAAPGRGWCRHLPPVVFIGMFPTFVIFFMTVQTTCTNTLPLGLAFLPLFFLWIYLPVGFVELLAGVSVLVPFGRARGLRAAFIVSPRAFQAGAFRLTVTALVLAAVLVAAYW